MDLGGHEGVVTDTSTNSRMELPVLRFLERGKQLMRVQERIVKQMIGVVETEESAFRRPPTDPAEVAAFIERVHAGLANSSDRFADIQLMFQLFYCRHVDNFQMFLEEVVRDIASVEPKVLDGVKVKKSEKYTVDELRELRLDRIGFLGLGELCDLLGATLAFNLFASGQEAEGLILIFNIRNLVIHKNGIADDFFVRRNPTAMLSIGDQFQFTPGFIQQSFETLNQASGNILNRAQERFNLWRGAA